MSKSTGRNLISWISQLKSWKVPPSIKLFLKISISGLAIYLTAKKIDVKEAIHIITECNIYWLILGVFTFNLSQWISAVRLKNLLEELGIQASYWFHIKLFYFGMLYNIILPGGIGGDAYKVILLKNQFNKRARDILKALFLDRLSGLAGLIFLALILALIIDMPWNPHLNTLTLALSILIYPGYFLANKLIFPSFTKSFLFVNILGILMQGTQIICAYCILLSLGAENNYLSYLLVFLLSSIATIIPLTLGGLGMRELVFIYAADFLIFDKEIAIALSLLFFLITAASSLLGIFVNPKTKENTAHELHTSQQQH
ncbi:lysylphosphatidylglycerol synthase transmembrane domain-containing protein [Fulvivirga sediminis]|uniref:Flippase-like domain-containing protein n=1 Tax=Fulvivirga sediminis TaxID=2803949 RepID=A0A937FCT4_9BACT|nr:lysylphosphatidylglycerol synthase transmembrane domain-containing protein [Fulvivirga sediminis]MBL3658545.1 flippase-like domain-containing protein [Fulvivirga sediminis]